MQKVTSFRSWLENMWHDHQMEIEAYTGKFPEYPRQEYFRKYKWWLKREFKHRNNKVKQL